MILLQDEKNLGNYYQNPVKKRKLSFSTFVF